MDKKINILHISDIHFGAEPILPQVTSTALARRKNVLDPLIELIGNIGHPWKPDIVAISGDIGWKGSNLDYEQAGNWLQRLLDALNLNKSDLILCPGNHDLNRKSTIGLVQTAPSTEADKLLEIENLDNFIRPFEEYNKFCNNFGISPLYIGTEKQTQYLFGYRELKGLKFIVLNSAWFCRNDNDRAKLWLGLPQIEVMKSNAHLFNPNDYDTSQITIAIFHHPKEWFSDEEYRSRTDRKCTYNYLIERCHIVLTGHVHSAIDEPDRDKNRAWVFTGGTTYSKADYRNSFQIIQIDIENRDAIRCAYELDPRKDEWNINYGKSDYPLIIDSAHLNKREKIIENEKISEYDYNSLSKKAKFHALRYVEQKSRAITRSLKLPDIIERKVAVHNKEERIGASPDSRLLLNTYNNNAPLSEMVSVENPTFLFGELGSGKSTLVGDYVAKLSEKIEGLIPIIMPVSFFRNKEITTVVKLSDVISQYVNEQINPTQNNFYINKALQNKYEITLVIDGLDELDKDSASNLLIKIEDLVANWSGLRVIATGRPIELHGLNYSKWQCLEMMPLSKNEQKDLLINEALVDGLSKEQAENDAKERLLFLYEMPELLSIASTPLTIRLMRPYLQRSGAKKTLGDLLYDITHERLGEWDKKQGKKGNFADFTKEFPDAISRERLLGSIAAEIYKSPDKSISKESLYTVIDSELTHKENKNTIIYQSSDFLTKSILQESDNIITFPSQPLFQCALGIYIFNKLKNDGNVDLTNEFEAIWREYSFASTIARRKNLISVLRIKFQNYINELLKLNKEDALPAISLIIVELDDIDTAKFFIKPLNKFDFRPLCYLYTDTKQVSAAAYARWFYLAGEEGFDWFYEQYLNPKYPNNVALSRNEDLIFKYWLSYYGFNINSKYRNMLSALISPCIAAQSWHCETFIPTISLVIPNLFKPDERIKLIISNLYSNITRDNAINLLKDEVKKGNKEFVLNSLEADCKKSDNKEAIAARLWMELCSEKPPISVTNSIISATIHEEYFDLFIELEKRLGHDNVRSYLNWCVLKDSKIATDAAIHLYKKGEKDIFRIGKGLIIGLHDGIKVVGAEDILENLVNQNLEQGLEWLIEQFDRKERDGAHSACWRILLKGLTTLNNNRTDLFLNSIYHLGELILPRYPEIRRLFQILLSQKHEYRDVLQKQLGSLDNNLRYNAACILLTCFPEEEELAAEIIIKSTTHSYNHGEWNSFCMRLTIGRKVLDHICIKLENLLVVPKTFALALLYHNKYNLNKENFKELVFGLLGDAAYLDTYYSKQSNNSLKQILAQDEVFEILKKNLDNKEFSRESAKALIDFHSNKLSMETYSKCLSVYVNSFREFRFYKFDRKLDEYFGNKEFIESIELYRKKIQEKTSQEPLISIYLRTLFDLSAWKDLLWEAMFRGDYFSRSKDDIEWAIMWIFNKGRANKDVGKYIGIYATEFLNHPSITNSSYNNPIPLLTFLAHEFSDIDEEKIKYALMNYNSDEEINAVLLSRLGYIPEEYKPQNRRGYLTAFMSNTHISAENVTIEQISDIIREADEIHKEFCIWIDKVIISGSLCYEELVEIALKSRNGALFASMVLFCRKSLKEYSFIIRVIGINSSKLENNQVEKSVFRAFRILRNIVAHNPMEKEKYLLCIEDTIRAHEHNNVVLLYRELLRYQAELSGTLLPRLLSELSKYSYRLSWELGYLLADYFAYKVKDEQKNFFVQELKKAINFISSQINEFPSLSDGIREWLFSLAFFYLSGDTDEESERVFLFGLQSAFIQDYNTHHNYDYGNFKRFAAKDILNTVYPLLDKVPQAIIRHCVLKGVRSDIPEIQTCCRILLAIMK